MDSVTLIERKVIPMTFSSEFESLLLNLPTDHISLTYDIELQANTGLNLLEELEDVHDIKHIKELTKLAEYTNKYIQNDSTYFKYWSMSIANDLLDEVDLIILTHGSDLQELGLSIVNQGSVIILLATASLLATKIS